MPLCKNQTSLYSPPSYSHTISHSNSLGRCCEVELHQLSCLLWVVRFRSPCCRHQSPPGLASRPASVLLLVLVDELCGGRKGLGNHSLLLLTGGIRTASRGSGGGSGSGGRCPSICSLRVVEAKGLRLRQAGLGPPQDAVGRGVGQEEVPEGRRKGVEGTSVEGMGMEGGVW